MPTNTVPTSSTITPDYIFAVFYPRYLFFRYYFTIFSNTFSHHYPLSHPITIVYFSKNNEKLKIHSEVSSNYYYHLIKDSGI